MLVLFVAVSESVSAEAVTTAVPEEAAEVDELDLLEAFLSNDQEPTLPVSLAVVDCDSALATSGLSQLLLESVSTLTCATVASTIDDAAVEEAAAVVSSFGWLFVSISSEEFDESSSPRKNLGLLLLFVFVEDGLAALLLFSVAVLTAATVAVVV